MTNSLPEIITEIGDDAAATLLKTDATVTRSWRLRYRYPRREKAKEIIKIMSKHPLGPITWEGIYAD